MKDKKTKKVLIISYYYPPIPSIASLRIVKLAKYVREFGWEPIVISGDQRTYAGADEGIELPDVETYRIRDRFFELVKTSAHQKINFKETNSQVYGETSNLLLQKVIYKILKYLKYLFLEYLLIPDRLVITWKRDVIKKALEIIDTDKPDLILTSHSPATCHIIGSFLSRRTGIPWIADYRDLWSQSHLVQHSSIRHFFEKKLERCTMKYAKGIVVVAMPAAQKLSVFLNKQVDVITNGYDPEDYKPEKLYSFSKEKISRNKLSFVYTGNVYDGKQNFYLFFNAVSKLLKNGDVLIEDIEIQFWGTNKELIVSQILDDVRDIVIFKQRVPYNEITKIQMSASILLLFTWNVLEDKSIYSGKLFEYLGAQRPIFAIPANPGSVVDDLLHETNAGTLCSNENEIANQILSWYKEFKKNGNIEFHGIKSEIEKYSRKEQAKQFAKLFNETINK